MTAEGAARTWPADHPVFAGHFPGRPVVPAVMLLEAVADAVAAAQPGARVTGFPSAKFLRPLGPDVEARVTLAPGAASGTARFEVHADGALLAQGRVTYSHEG